MQCAAIARAGGLGNGLARCSGRSEGGLARSTTASEYGAPADFALRRAKPARPPPPAAVICCNRRPEPFPAYSHSHSVHCGPARETDVTPVAPAGRKSSELPTAQRNNHVSADSRLETRSTTTADTFKTSQGRCLPASLVKKTAARSDKFWHCRTSDGWPLADSAAEKFTGDLLCASEGQRRRYVVTENAGCCPITGSSRGREGQRDNEGMLPFISTSSETYQGHEGTERTETCRKHCSHLSSITHGDRDKVKENCTTNRAAYHPPPLETTPPGHAYSRAAAVSSILHSSVHLGACPSLSQPPPTALLPTSWGPGERVREREHRNKSFLPEGDMDRERVRSRMKHSTSLSSHKPPPPGSYPAHVNSSRLHTASSILLGPHPHQQAPPPSSTMATSYLPHPSHTHKVRAPAKDNIPLNYFPGHLVDSTAASSYRTHSGDLRHSLPPHTLRNLKISHW